MPVTLALGRQTQEDLQFETSMGKMLVRLYLNKKAGRGGMCFSSQQIMSRMIKVQACLAGKA
jgi:hypothetical protein